MYVMEMFQKPENMTLLGLFALIIAAAIREFFSWLSKKNIQNSQTRYDQLKQVIETMAKKFDKMSEENEENGADIKLLKEKVAIIEESSDLLLKQSTDMYEWHNKSDQDGVKVWYIRQSLENALRDNAKATAAIAKNIELQTRLLEEMIQNQRSMTKEQNEVIKTLHGIERSLIE